MNKFVSFFCCIRQDDVAPVIIHDEIISREPYIECTERSSNVDAVAFDEKNSTSFELI